jgi:hypothetical protein
VYLWGSCEVRLGVSVQKYATTIAYLHISPYAYHRDIVEESSRSINRSFDLYRSPHRHPIPSQTRNDLLN